MPHPAMAVTIMTDSIHEAIMQPRSSLRSGRIVFRVRSRSAMDPSRVCSIAGCLISVAMMCSYLDSKAGDVPERARRLADHGVVQFPRTYVKWLPELWSDSFSRSLRYAVSAARGRTDLVRVFRSFLDRAETAVTIE